MATEIFDATQVSSKMTTIQGKFEEIGNTLNTANESVARELSSPNEALYGEAATKILGTWDENSSSLKDFINIFDNWSSLVVAIGSKYAQLENETFKVSDEDLETISGAAKANRTTSLKTEGGIAGFTAANSNQKRGNYDQYGISTSTELTLDNGKIIRTDTYGEDGVYKELKYNPETGEYEWKYYDKNRNEISEEEFNKTLAQNSDNAQKMADTFLAEEARIAALKEAISNKKVNSATDAQELEAMKKQLEELEKKHNNDAEKFPDEVNEIIEKKKQEREELLKGLEGSTEPDGGQEKPEGEEAGTEIDPDKPEEEESGKPEEESEEPGTEVEPDKPEESESTTLPEGENTITVDGKDYNVTVDENGIVTSITGKGGIITDPETIGQIVMSAGAVGTTLVLKNGQQFQKTDDGYVIIDPAKDAASKTRATFYNEKNQVVQKTWESDDYFNIEQYDPETGNITYKEVNNNGTITKTEYKDGTRLGEREIVVEYENGDSITTNYNSNNQKTSKVEVKDDVTTTTEYEYYEDGKIHVERTSDSNNTKVTTTYNKDNSTTTVDENSSRTITTERDKDGNPVTETTYDKKEKTTTVETHPSENATRRETTYDDDKTRRTVTEVENGKSTTTEYKNNEKTSEEIVTATRTTKKEYEEGVLTRKTTKNTSDDFETVTTYKEGSETGAREVVRNYTNGDVKEIHYDSERNITYKHENVGGVEKTTNIDVKTDTETVDVINHNTGAQEHQVKKDNEIIERSSHIGNHDYGYTTNTQGEKEYTVPTSWRSFNMTQETMDAIIDNGQEPIVVVDQDTYETTMEQLGKGELNGRTIIFKQGQNVQLDITEGNGKDGIAITSDKEVTVFKVNDDGTCTDIHNNNTYYNADLADERSVNGYREDQKVAVSYEDSTAHIEQHRKDNMAAERGDEYNSDVGELSIPQRIEIENSQESHIPGAENSAVVKEISENESIELEMNDDNDFSSTNMKECYHYTLYGEDGYPIDYFYYVDDGNGQYHYENGKGQVYDPKTNAIYD